MSKQSTTPHGRPLPDGKRRYGWVPDVPDHRDKVLAVPRMKLPKSVDLRDRFNIPKYDQGALGSCTANAVARAIQFNQVEQGLPLVMPSRLFIYFAERVMEGTIEVDSGATIRESIKAVNKGYCSEEIWPYYVDRFADKPSAEAYADAKGHKCLKYQRVPQTIYSMKAALARANPFVLGFSVYESFETDKVARTGKAPMPEKGEAFMGGHAVFCLGYAEDGSWILDNSWSDSWGERGSFTLPPGYLTNGDLSADFWSIALIK
jgi:C1A family cysteine protease